MRNWFRKQTPEGFTAEQAGSGEDTDGRNQTETDCPCKRIECAWHGNCEACRAHHVASRHSRPCEKASAAGKRNRNR